MIDTFVAWGIPGSMLLALLGLLWQCWDGWKWDRKQRSLRTVRPVGTGKTLFRATDKLGNQKLCYSRERTWKWANKD